MFNWTFPIPEDTSQLFTPTAGLVVEFYAHTPNHAWAPRCSDLLYYAIVPLNPERYFALQKKFVSIKISIKIICTP